ncbi:ATP-binding protein [Pseudophaeobacter sp. EL27]|uniref:ATP-binding protein n=1 Tax=Pseudophaeobacter sp. EL27 TaxID=2107580 RepID=UPI000EFAA49F|nr:ATP-binding protein [Pseudophaeobacter sp. EL27]
MRLPFKVIGITRKIALAAAILGVLSGLILGLVLLLLEHGQRIDTARLNAERIIRATLPQLESAYWEVDVPDARSIMNGLFEVPVIQGLRVEDPLLSDALRNSSGLVDLSARKPEVEIQSWLAVLFKRGIEFESRSYVLSNPRDGQEIGQLIVDFSYRAVQQDMVARSYVVLGSSILQTLLVTGVIFLMIQLVVIRPLARLQAAALRVRDGHSFQLKGRDQRMFDSARQDEISRLARAFRRTVTELEASRDNLLELVDERTTELLEARNEAVKASRAKSVFLANMSHELRTPLNAIVGLSGILLEMGQSRKSLRHLTDMQAAAAQLSENIDSILDLSKIEAGRLSPEQVWFDLDDLLDDVLTQTRALLGDRPVQLTWDYQQGLPQDIRTDPLRLRQILMNLASNAVKFTESGEICLSVHHVEETLVFRVRDTGIGIAPDQLAEVFKPFGQADSSTTRQFGGTGLGLPIAQRLAEALGAKLDVESTLGQGSCFRLSITPPTRRGAAIPPTETGLCITGSSGPVQQIRQISYRLGLNPEAECPTFHIQVSSRHVTFSQSENGTGLCEHIELPITKREFKEALDGLQEAGEISPPEGLPLASRDVLIVEDNRINLSVFVGLIEALGANVRTACNGLEALDQVAQAMPDVILMDLHMPHMDGHRAFEVLQVDFGASLAPVIAASANATPEENLRCITAGFADFLSKPVNPAQLRLVLEKEVSRSDNTSQDRVFDADRGVLHAGGDRALYGRNLSRFHVDLAVWHQSLQILESSPDPASLHELLHVIRGAAATMGAMDLAETVRGVGEVKPDVVAVISAIERLQPLITKALPLVDEKAANPHLSLEQIGQLISKHDMSALEAIRGLETLNLTPQGAAAFKDLSQALEGLDFITAETAFARLLTYLQED